MRGISLVLVASILSPSIALAQAAQSAAPARDGRYTIFFSPHVRADTFLLDTATGKVWVLTKFSDLNGAPSAWDYMPRLDTAADESAFDKLMGFAPPTSGAAKTLNPNPN